MYCIILEVKLYRSGDGCGGLSPCYRYLPLLASDGSVANFLIDKVLFYRMEGKWQMPGYSKVFESDGNCNWVQLQVGWSAMSHWLWDLLVGARELKGVKGEVHVGCTFKWQINGLKIVVQGQVLLSYFKLDFQRCHRINFKFCTVL